MSYRQDPGTGRFPLVVVTSGEISAVEPLSGRRIWHQKFRRGYLAVAFDGDRIYVASYADLYCLDCYTGAVHWRVSTRNVGRRTLVAQGGCVFLAREGRVECYSAEGNAVWESPVGGTGYPTAIGFPGNFVQCDQTP